MQPTLTFIKLGVPGDPPASGTVEVHWDTFQDGSYKRVGDYTSDFSPADALNGTWQMFGPQDAPMLGFIKLRQVGNLARMVEVHWASLQDGAYKRVGDYVSDFSVDDADNGVWQLINTGDELGAPVLGFIKLLNVGNAAGMAEVHLDVLENGSYTRVLEFVSDFSIADYPNGVWQLPFAGVDFDSDGVEDLVSVISFIKLQHVGNPEKTVEVHGGEFTVPQGGPPGDPNVYRRVVDVTSDFSQNDAGNGTWQLFFPPDDGDLGFIKLQHVGNVEQMVEVHLDQLQDGIYTRVGDYVSDFSVADAENGVWGFLD
jgi:hypothetical protein